MSYEKVIGFGVDPENIKGPPIALTSLELDILQRLKVRPIRHDLKALLGDNVEPEPKIFVELPRGLRTIRTNLLFAENALIIPGQIYEDKNPLTSILIDTVHNGFPTAMLDGANYTLRYRFETNPKTGMRNHGDFNEKSGLKGASVIGGCLDRFERELEQAPDQSFKDGFDAFKAKYRGNGDPAFCDPYDYESMHACAGYQAARNEYAFAVKHPKDNVLFVFEACEDFWHSLHADMSRITAKLFEFEFEPKQVWGDLPHQARSPDGFKPYLYEMMTSIQNYLHQTTPGSSINKKSKAEIAKEHLESNFGFAASDLATLGLATVFARNVPTGYHGGFNAIQYSLMMGDTLENTMERAERMIYQNGARLHKEKKHYNADAPKSYLDAIGVGGRMIDINDNAGRRPVLAFGA